jgi:hypothetical protein
MSQTRQFSTIAPQDLNKDAKNGLVSNHNLQKTVHDRNAAVL